MRKSSKTQGIRDQPADPPSKRKEQEVGGYVGQLARSVGVYGRPIPRPKASSSSRSRLGDGKYGGDSKPSAEDRFTEKERAVIANLEKYTAEGLRQLSENLRASCLAKMEELNEAREEKAKMQVRQQQYF
jgi:hypothetical protein